MRLYGFFVFFFLYFVIFFFFNDTATTEIYTLSLHDALPIYDMQVILSGGPAAIEREYAEAISARMQSRPIDLIGRTDLKQLLAIFERATAVISPDAGSAHLANEIGRAHV